MNYTPSLSFDRERETLFNKKLAGEINEAEYSRLLDELIKEEANSQQSVILELAIQEMRQAEQQKIKVYEEEKREEEEKKKMAAEEEERSKSRQKLMAEQEEKRKERLRELADQEEQKRKEQARYDYRWVTVPGEIAVLKQKYQSARTRYTWLQGVSIISSIIATSIIGLDVPRWLPVIFSGAAAITAGFLSTFQMRERNYSSYQAIGGMETECHNYDQRIERYAGTNDDQAFQIFSSRISEIKQQHISQELAFWKTTEKSEREEENQQHAIQQKEEPEESTEENSDGKSQTVEQQKD